MVVHELLRLCGGSCFVFFFFNDTATTEIYTLSLHDALPISPLDAAMVNAITQTDTSNDLRMLLDLLRSDRKSTRLNSSHSQISYAVFCLKKKQRERRQERLTATARVQLHPDLALLQHAIARV